MDDTYIYREERHDPEQALAITELRRVIDDVGLVSLVNEVYDTTGKESRLRGVLTEVEGYRVAIDTDQEVVSFSAEHDHKVHSTSVANLLAHILQAPVDATDLQ